MSLFFILFFAIYGGVHAYFFHKARSAFHPTLLFSCILGLALLFLTLPPLFVRMLERHGRETLALVIAYPGYLWMGFLFLFFCIGMLVDLGGAGASAFGALTNREVPDFLLGRTWKFLLPCILSLLITLYGYFEAQQITRETVTITTTKLPAGVPRLRVTQLSDVHLGLLVGEKRLERMLKVVKQSDPDIVVVTGDLLDGQPDGCLGMAPLFSGISPRMGKFVVTGNHDFYVGVERLEEFARAAGFTLLRNEGVSVGGCLNVAGVDDPAGGKYDGSKVPEKEILSRLPRKLFTIFLKHRPAVDQSAAEFFDLQLSGHVHKGQIFPFNLLTHLFYPVKMGLSPAGEGASLYVSRGTGTWGPPVRFLAPPEVSVIDLVKR